MVQVTDRRIRPARLSSVLAAVAVLILGSAACGDDGDTTAAATDAPDASSESSDVLATTSIWADVTAQVACGELEVPSIIPAGVDAHEFEPSIRDSDEVAGAQLVVANGLDLEEGLIDTLDAAAASGAVVVPLADGVTLIGAGDPDSPDGDEDASGDDHDHEGDEDAHEGDEDAHEGDEDAHDHGGVDPHVWMDPRRVAEAVPTIADALIETAATELSPEQIDTCAAEYVDELDALAAEMAASFEPLAPEQRRLVTDHEALGYLADGFGLEVIGTVIPSTSSLGEANPRELEELAETMEAAGVSRIYAAATGASDVAAALGDRVGEGGQVEVVELYTESLGESGRGADSYLDMMRVNAERISGS